MSHSFILLPHAPLLTYQSQSELTTVGINGGPLCTQTHSVVGLANQLENLRAVPPKPKVSNPESRDGHGTKDKTPKKVKPADTGDTPRKHHKSCEKSQSKHSPTEKPPAQSSISMTWCPRPAAGGCSSPNMSLCCQDGEGSGKDSQLKDSRGPASEAVARKSLSQGY